jgi:hypothetical protein
MRDADSIHEMYAKSSPFRGATRSSAVDIRTSASYRMEMGLGPRLGLSPAGGA